MLSKYKLWEYLLWLVAVVRVFLNLPHNSEAVYSSTVKAVELESLTFHSSFCTGNDSSITRGIPTCTYRSIWINAYDRIKNLNDALAISPWHFCPIGTLGVKVVFDRLLILDVIHPMTLKTSELARELGLSLMTQQFSHWYSGSQIGVSVSRVLAGV